MASAMPFLGIFSAWVVGEDLEGSAPTVFSLRDRKSVV